MNGGAAKRACAENGEVQGKSTSAKSGGCLHAPPNAGIDHARVIMLEVLNNIRIASGANRETDDRLMNSYKCASMSYARREHVRSIRCQRSGGQHIE